MIGMHHFLHTKKLRIPLGVSIMIEIHIPLSVGEDANHGTVTGEDQVTTEMETKGERKLEGGLGNERREGDSW
jgi:hypothetical protein